MRRVRSNHRPLAVWLLVLVGSGCASDAIEPSETLSVSATNVVIAERPTEFQTIVKILNPTARTLEFRFRCGGGLNIVSIGDSLGPPLWTSNRSGTECGGASELQTLGSEEALSYTFSVQAKGIVTQVLPDGVYRVDAVVPISTGTIVANAGRITISR